MHDIRVAYGWDDEKILDYAEFNGIGNLIDQWKFIREDEVNKYRMLMSIAPMARTPMDKKSSSAMNNYAKKLDKQLDSLVPWQSRVATLGGLKGKVEEGKVTVLLDSDEIVDATLFKDASIKRE